MNLTPGTRIGPYEVVAKLGEGGMGEVYTARDTRLGRDVAIKLLPARLHDSPSARQRFEREARTVASLQHPGICTVHDVGVTVDGRTYLVMERLQGRTLQQRLAGGPLDWAEVVPIALALADALGAAHTAGLVHRDVKPANIMLTPNGPKLLDFGIAKLIAPQDDADTTTVLLTEQGTVVGTAAYMSPEQLRGEPLDARSDLFALGLVMYEMLTGRAAFARPTVALTTAALLHEQPPPIGAERPGVPAALEHVADKAMEKDRELRYQHASEIRSDLLRVTRAAAAAAAPSAPGPAEAPRAPGRRRPVLIAAAIALAAAAGYAGFGRHPRAAVLTDKDTLVLAGFQNTTGEPVFDNTLAQGLAVQLQQSPFLALVSDARIRQVLVLMGHPADAPLTPDLAREVCERTQSTAVIDGSIARLGGQYVVGLTVKTCASDEVIFAQQQQAARPEDVLTAISDAARQFRTRAGESLPSVEKFSMSLVDATTPSLEAWRAYATGLHQIVVTGQAAALPFFKRAVDLDPQFAMAQAMLGLCYNVVGETTLAEQHTRKAYDLRDRTSERERFSITALYYRQVTGNLEKARQTFEAWTEAYPRQVDAFGLLSGLSTHGTGRYDEALAAAQKALALDPAHVYGYLNQASAYTALNRFADADRVIGEGHARKLDLPDFYLYRYVLAAIAGDRLSMQANAALARDKQGYDGLTSHLESLAAAREGHADAARVLARRGAALEQADQRSEAAAIYTAAMAVWEGWMGDAAGARRDAASALGISTGRDVRFAAGAALAIAGDGDKARPLADDLAARFPEDTSVQAQYLPTLRALIALDQGNPAGAVEALKPASGTYALAHSALSFQRYFGAMYPAYLRGLAYLALGRGADAAGEFQQILDHSGLVELDPVGVIARLQLARAWRLAGDNDRARAAYVSFLEQWAAADKDLPVLVQARAEYARLQ